MIVYVESIRVPDGSTLGYGSGIDAETGDRVVFAGDQRPMRHLEEVLESDETVEVLVEPHQIIGRSKQ